MKVTNRITVILAIVALGVWVGCTSTSVDNSAKPPAEPVYTGPKATDPPDTWTHGKVFQVWPYENGKLMAYLGSDDGIRPGDKLALTRGGVMLNTVEVIDVHKFTFSGRVIDRKDEGAQPKEGDLVVRIPPTGL